MAINSGIEYSKMTTTNDAYGEKTKPELFATAHPRQFSANTMWLSVWIGHLWSSFKYGCSSLGKLCKVVIKKKSSEQSGAKREQEEELPLLNIWCWPHSKTFRLCQFMSIPYAVQRIVNLREKSNLVHGTFTACVLVPQPEWSTNAELKTNIGPNNLNVNARSIFRSLEVFSNNDADFLPPFSFSFSSSFLSAFVRAKSNRTQHQPSSTRFQIYIMYVILKRIYFYHSQSGENLYRLCLFVAFTILTGSIRCIFAVMSSLMFFS